MEASSDNASASFAQIAEAISKAASIGILTHRRPDGDAIGSCVALGEALEALGKRIFLINADEVPDSLRFLSGSERFEVASEISQPYPVDLVIVLDSAGHDRVGDEAWNALSNAGLVINIDHHISNTRFGDLNYVDAKSPATGQIIYELISDQGWRLTTDGRDALYAAISTDTGSFRYPSTTAATYRIAAELIDEGLDVGGISQKLYESYPLRRLFLLRDLLQKMEVRDDGRVVAIKLTLAMAEAVGMRPGDTEGLIDVIRSVDTVIVAVFFEEMADGKIRVSSRSKSTVVDVGQVCAVFGGGGHQLAAGTRMRGPIDDAADRFLTEVSRQLDGSN
ncbi:MAG: bifunctional oligoribonuclease/PAP phosphatase NrnA [Verrucomicrobiae bacterium]|nr:bifunctional oligoribonuclease/PAP phosphatase NrnA [Verrucomicrobiae bacterium]